MSEAWLREFVELPDDSAAVAEKLTLAGLEVDGIEPAGPPLPQVVVAEVLAVEAHADAERLSVCEVSDGTQTRQVVCGAPNVRAGLKVAWARPGAVLPGERVIEQASIRGVESAGMLCSAAELGLGEDADGILELPATMTRGEPLVTALALDDVVFDIGLTPNRGDCFCALGIARDLGVLYGRSVPAPSVPAVAAQNDARFEVVLDDPQGCARYAGRVVSGIRSDARTPAWMAERLRRCGVRSIDPVVDITNYVMLELGQPMHAFDRARLSERIIVRGAAAGERLELLDGQTIELDAGTLVIADGAAPVALAGVMGGAGSAVGEDTRDLFLEAAWFDPVRLAGVARRYGMQTDASTRFERGVDPTMQQRAIERATALLIEICGGEPGPTMTVEHGAHLPPPVTIDFDPGAVNRLLGTDLDDARIGEILGALDMRLETGAARWQVAPPAFRPDISIEADLVEEVARIAGYDTIPTRLPRGAGEPALPVPRSGLERRLREGLAARGYLEAITYSFVAPQLAAQLHPGAAVTPLANPISSEMAVMRPSLWPGLIGAARHNLNRQHEDLRLFEIGMVFADSAGSPAQAEHLGGLCCGRAAPAHWSGKSREVDFFDLKQDVEWMLQNLFEEPVSFVAAEHPALHPGQSARVLREGSEVGWLGALHPALARGLDIARPLFLFEFCMPQRDGRRAAQYHPISRFPAVRRDLSVVVDESVRAGDCLAVAAEAAGGILRDLQLFDVYRGQGIDSGKKSLALGLIFQDASSTLTDDDVDTAVTQVLDALRDRVGGALRE